MLLIIHDHLIVPIQLSTWKIIQEAGYGSKMEKCMYTNSKSIHIFILYYIVMWYCHLWSSCLRALLLSYKIKQNVLVNVLVLWRDTMTKTTYVEWSIILGNAYGFRGLVHKHHCQDHDSRCTGMLLEQKLIVHIWSQIGGGGGAET